MAACGRTGRTAMGERSQTGFVAGLQDVVAAETRLSGVDGEAGELTIAGFPVEELAGRASFEETVYLLWHDALPDPGQLADFREELAGRRELSRATLDLLRAVAAEKVPVMDVLRMAAGTASPGTDAEQALALVASLPTVVATYSRLVEGEEPVTPIRGLAMRPTIYTCLRAKYPARSSRGPWRPTS